MLIMSIGVILLILAILIYIVDKGADLISDKKNKKHKGMFFIIILLLLITSGIVQLHQDYQEDKDKKYLMDSGKISGKLTDKKMVLATIDLGVGSVIYPQDNPNGIIVGGRPISLWIENGELKISRKISNKEGKNVAEIKANEWMVNLNYIFDKNFDKNAFEVVDDEGKVRLQVVYNGEAVKLAILDYTDDGKIAYVGPINDGTAYTFGDNYPIDSDFSIEPLFKYPSQLHPGERIRK